MREQVHKNAAYVALSPMYVSFLSQGGPPKFGKYDWRDPLDLRSQLTGEERQIQVGNPNMLHFHADVRVFNTAARAMIFLSHRLSFQPASSPTPLPPPTAASASFPLYYLFLYRENGKYQRTAEEFAQKVLIPRVVVDNRHGTFDRSVITEMGRAGLLGCTLQGYGCAGVGHVAYGLITR